MASYNLRAFGRLGARIIHEAHRLVILEPEEVRPFVGRPPYEHDQADDEADDAEGPTTPRRIRRERVKQLKEQEKGKSPQAGTSKSAKLTRARLAYLDARAQEALQCSPATLNAKTDRILQSLPDAYGKRD